MIKDRFQIGKKIALIGAAFVLLFPIGSGLALAAEDELTPLTVSNTFMEVSVNKETGRFSVNTKQGSPLKSGDDNKALLFKEKLPETSFTTFRINGKDYIFGNGYGFLGSNGSFTSSPANQGLTNKSVWNIEGMDITQTLTLVDDPTNPNAGNMKVSYQVKNKTSQNQSVGSRILLDTMLGPQDASPISVAGGNTYISNEKVITGQLPYYWSATDNPINPKVMSYGFMQGWGNKAPNQMIIAHWNGISQTKWDYTVNPLLDFTNKQNAYGSADSAVALYWDPANIAPGGEAVFETYYGLGSFFTSKKEATYRLQIGAPKQLTLNDNRNGYNENEFEIRVDIDNAIDRSVNMEGIQVTLGLPDELELTPGQGITKVVGRMKGGETQSVTWRVKPKVQLAYKAAQFQVIAQAAGGEESIQASYVVLPALTGEIPSMQLMEVFPRKLYTLDEKPALTLQGAGFEILKGSSGWNLDVIRDRDGASVAIPASDVSIQDDKQITAKLNLTSDLWKQHKLEVGSYTVRLTAGSKVFEKKIEFTLDKSFKSKDYGILLVVGDNMTQETGQTYSLLPVKSETELANYKMEFERSGGRQVSLLEIRGSILAKNGDGGKVVYEIDKGSTINSVIHHDTTDMLTAIFGEASQKITIQKSAKDSTHAQDYINLKGNGALSIPNFKFAYGPFSVELEDGKKYALEAKEDEQEQKIEIKWDVLKGLSIIQRLAWFQLNIKNAVIGTESVSFGGRLALDFEPGPKKDTGKDGDSGNPSNPPSNPPTDVTENVDGEDDGAGSVLVSVDLDEAKFGVRQLDNAFGPAGKFGFLGLRAEGEAGLPKNLVPGLDLGVDGVVRVDTFEKKYEIEANVQFKVVELNGMLTIRLTDTNFPIIDNFRFVVGGEPGIPLIPIAPVAYITKGGGGIYNIYDTLMGNYQFLPPLKLEMIGGLSIAKVFKADDATVGLSMRGVEFSGAFEVLGIQLLEEVYGSVLLKDSFSQFGVELKAGAKINIKNLLTGEVYVVFRYDPEQHGKLGPVYLAGGGNLQVKLPRGLVLAAAEGEISSEKVAGNVEFIGIPWGFEYEWGDKKPSITLGKRNLMSSRSLMVGEAAPSNEGAAPDQPAKSFIEQTYYDESGSVSGTMSFGTNMKPVASSGPRSNVQQQPTRRLLKAASPNVYSIPVSSEQEMALLDITYSGDPAELQVTDPSGNPYPLVSGENYDIQEVPAEESASGEREQSVLISMKHPMAGTWRVTTDRELEWTLENVTVPPTFTTVDVQQPDATNPQQISVNWQSDHTTNEKVSLFLSTNNENDPGSLLVQDLDVSAGSAQIVLPNSTPTGTYYVKAVLSQGDSNVTSKYSSQPLYLVNPHQPASPGQVHLRPAGNGLFELSWNEQAVDGYTVQVLDENGKAIPSLGVIELAGDVHKANIGGTLRNEAGEKVGMLPGSSYKVSIGAYKLVDGVKVYSEPAVTDAVLLPEPQPAHIQLSVFHANHEPITNTYSQAGTTTYITNENSTLLHMQADQAVSSDVIVNNVKQEGQSGADWERSISLNEGENVIQLFSTNAQGDITASSVRVISDTTVPDLKVESARTTSDQQAVIVKGMAEPGSTVTINEEPIDVQTSGAFEKSIPMEGYLSKPIVVTAKDIAGNENMLNAEVVNSQLSSLTKVELRAKEGLMIDGVLQLEAGSEQSLELIGTDKEGKSFSIDPNSVKWSVLLGDTNGDISEQGRLQAEYEGDMVIKASYSVAGDFAFEDTMAVKVTKPRGAPETPPVQYDDWYVPPTSGGSEHGDGNGSGSESTDSPVKDTLQKILQRLIEQEQGVDYITSAILTNNQESVVKIRNRAVIRIPAQPLQESVGLGIGAVRDPKKYEVGRLKVIGDIYEFKFDKPTVLQKPAELTVRYSLEELQDPSRAAIYWYNEQTHKWEYVGGRVDPAAGTITASLPHFSKYALMYNGDLPVFEDMPEAHWSHDMVYRLASMGIVNGVPSGNGLAFEPDRSITRQEFAKIAVGAEGATSVSTSHEISPEFVDQELVAAWAKPYVTAAIEQGWLGGTTKDEKRYLDPTVPISRAEAIAIIGRMMKVDTDAAGGAEDAFTDAEAIPGWAKPYVSMLVKLGVISGYPDGSLHSEAQITREEAAAMISKMLDAKISK
ncbi:S-layer homology domain-containing protein [Paenibacillus chondroitinus]|uniref:S-layer homology domain-containing protein n=1 Tax=Paenibacillus chondroitinus TaxID=59842 RepID=A0ABU6D5K1_9BACL|nr:MULTISPECIES: S-layer homology domain-containing protein [Paenibacillus]MCY9660127.1 S-layer homology domain-containing protein [Paenibacillus anseongense]MEB4793014.1 S-layer homology domain-containing protein [Paenibacillus chondroitinus]